ncbi:hypothetical protein PR202_gb09443 [Eleusine coracana subsp. coracana]|uniref:RBR-type E3 ubiquitin transferase n=1 Tax=Eleusine coracana subsp. coracana TaxID=191504 RepID=A0AAV5EGZ4_ELECO|nr:hypothetical protein PR202_gb09443 [Eleusine coracana subsp. coracana]
MAARGHEEIELSTEQLETNNQLQEDEERHQKYCLPEKQLLREQREIDELLNVCAALRDSKQCPSCKMAISKTEGCNKMTCQNCGKFLCYRCNQAISGYDHFWEGNCVLFEITNPQGRFGLFEEWDDDEDSDEDPEELEPERTYEYRTKASARFLGEIKLGMSPESSSSAPAGEVGAGFWAAGDDAAARLEAMAAADRPVDELSEEQYQINNQIQEDESYYYVTSSYWCCKPSTGMIWSYSTTWTAFVFFRFLYYQLQGDIRVYLNVCANGGAENEGRDDDEDDNEGLLYACTLQHLPPVTLTCVLPRSYPSTRAPYFVVTAKWLDEPEVSRFCSVLDEIWAELPGEEVVYRWADWLSSSSWSCIASEDQLVLGPDAISYGGDERAIGRNVTLDSTIPRMRDYSEERSHEIFDQSIHVCGVCFSENAGKSFVRLPCEHYFCVSCMESYCSIHVKEGSVTKLTCPDTSCRIPLPPAALRRLLGEDAYARWESLALRRTLDTMADVAYCRRCNAACFFTFCARCGDRRHVGGDCVLPEEKLDDLLERQRQMRPSVRELLTEEQRRRERRRVEELLSLREVLRTTRQCPSCRMAIAKTEGCNKMVCDKFFCYRCNKAISGYKHFVNGECGLFERVGKGRFPGRMNGNHPDLDEDVEIEEPGWIRAIRYPYPRLQLFFLISLLISFDFIQLTTAGRQEQQPAVPRLPDPLLRAVL